MATVAEKFKVNLTLEGKWTVEQKRKAYVATQMIREVVCNYSLRNELLKFEFEYWARPKWWKRKRLYKTNMMINESNRPSIDPEVVWESILRGKELSGIPNAEADITLRIEATDLVGYTYPTVIWQVIGNWVINSWTPAEIAGNLFHEWMHKIGFGHSYRRSGMWPGTVPYWCGNTVEKLAKLIGPTTISIWETSARERYPSNDASGKAVTTPAKETASTALSNAQR